MRISKNQVKAAVGNLRDVISLLEDAGAEIVDGAYVTPGMLVKAVGFKGHKQYTIAPKGADPASRRVTGAISVYHTTTGKLSFVRRPQFTLNGKPAGLFTLDGQPVIGYAD